MSISIDKGYYSLEQLRCSIVNITIINNNRLFIITGVLIPKLYVVTAYLPIFSCDKEIFISIINVNMEGSNELYTGEIVGMDYHCGITILKISTEVNSDKLLTSKHPYLKLGKSRNEKFDNFVNIFVDYNTIKRDNIVNLRTVDDEITEVLTVNSKYKSGSVVVSSEKKIIGIFTKDGNQFVSSRFITRIISKIIDSYINKRCEKNVEYDILQGYVYYRSCLGLSITPAQDYNFINSDYRKLGGYIVTEDYLDLKCGDLITILSLPGGGYYNLGVYKGQTIPSLIIWQLPYGINITIYYRKKEERYNIEHKIILTTFIAKDDKDVYKELV